MFVCLVVIIFIFVLGISHVMNGSSRHAFLNEPFILTCTVSEAADLNDRVQFFRKSNSGQIASLRQTSSCTVFSSPTGYSVSCGSGTNSSSSRTKKYHLKINNASVSDSADWWCALNRNGTRSQNFNLKVFCTKDNESNGFG